MDWLTAFLDIVLHLDAHMLVLVQEYGMWIYAILFAIIFAETGLVVAPFLPGDSLLFVTGALCGMGSLELHILLPLLVLAAFSGDNTNYWIGRLLGLRLLNHHVPRSGRRGLDGNPLGRRNHLPADISRPRPPRYGRQRD